MNSTIISTGFKELWTISKLRMFEDTFKNRRSILMNQKMKWFNFIFISGSNQAIVLDLAKEKG